MQHAVLWSFVVFFWSVRWMVEIVWFLVVRRRCRICPTNLDHTAHANPVHGIYYVSFLPLRELNKQLDGVYAGWAAGFGL